jgi:hypothetical protein
MQQEGEMPTTELLIPEIITDPKGLRAPIPPETERQPTSGKRAPTQARKAKWWLAASVVVALNAVPAEASRDEKTTRRVMQVL